MGGGLLAANSRLVLLAALQEALTKAQEKRPGEDVFEEARGKMQALLSANGCLTPEGDLCCTNNLLWFITAKKPV
jgi:hypothetical protein